MENSLVDHVTQSIKREPALLHSCGVKDLRSLSAEALGSRPPGRSQHLSEGVGSLIFQPLEDVV